MPDLCEHGDHPACCIECLEAAPKPEKVARPNQRLKADRWIQARYDGRCGRCHQPFEAGDPIGLTATHGWVDEDCAT